MNSDESFVYKMWLSKQFSWIEDVSFYFCKFVCDNFVKVISKPPEYLLESTGKYFYYSGFVWYIFAINSNIIDYVRNYKDHDYDKLLIYEFYANHCRNYEYHYKNKKRYVVPQNLTYDNGNHKIVGNLIEKVNGLRYYNDDTKIIVYLF